MKWTLNLCCCFFYCYHAAGQVVHGYLSNNIGLTGTYSNHFNNAFSFVSNAACLGTKQGFQCGLSLEQKWMMKELNEYQVAATMETGRSGIGVVIRSSGDADYGDKDLRLAYGRDLGKFELGIFFSYQFEQVRGYPNHEFSGCGIGIRVQVSPKLISGLEIGFPDFGQISGISMETASRSFRMGMGYEVSGDVLMTFQIVKLSGIPMNFYWSLDYQYNKAFLFSFGIDSGSGSPYFKSGWKKNQLAVLIYSSFHPLLGFSPGLIFLWQAKSGKG